MKKLYSIFIVFILVLVLISCSRIVDDIVPVISDELTPLSVDSIYVVTTDLQKLEKKQKLNYKSFISLLTENGFAYEEVTVVKPRNQLPKFSAKMKIIRVHDELINIVEYKSKLLLKWDASGISKDGTIFRTAMVDWASMPHFFKKDKLIVYYIGTDKEILAFLNDTFGEQFAGWNGS